MLSGSCDETAYFEEQTQYQFKTRPNPPKISAFFLFKHPHLSARKCEKCSAPRPNIPPRESVVRRSYHVSVGGICFILYQPQDYTTKKKKNRCIACMYGCHLDRPPIHTVHEK